MPRKNRSGRKPQVPKGKKRPRSWHHSHTSKNQKLPGWAERDRRAA